jgi:hypothetical protein
MIKIMRFKGESFIISVHICFGGNNPRVPLLVSEVGPIASDERPTGNGSSVDRDYEMSVQDTKDAQSGTLNNLSALLAKARRCLTRYGYWILRDKPQGILRKASGIQSCAKSNQTKPALPVLGGREGIRAMQNSWSGAHGELGCTRLNEAPFSSKLGNWAMS